MIGFVILSLFLLPNTDAALIRTTFKGVVNCPFEGMKLSIGIGEIDHDLRDQNDKQSILTILANNTVFSGVDERDRDVTQFEILAAKNESEGLIPTVFISNINHCFPKNGPCPQRFPNCHWRGTHMFLFDSAPDDGAKTDEYFHKFKHDIVIELDWMLTEEEPEFKIYRDDGGILPARLFPWHCAPYPTTCHSRLKTIETRDSDIPGGPPRRKQINKLEKFLLRNK